MLKLLNIIERSLIYHSKNNSSVLINSKILRSFSNRINVINVSSQKKNDRLDDSTEDCGKRKRNSDVNTSNSE